MQGMCGELRLADFDDLELSNLNRVPATVFDLGVNKATVAARRIAELDPYLHVRVLAVGSDRRDHRRRSSTGSTSSSRNATRWTSRCSSASPRAPGG